MTPDEFAARCDRASKQFAYPQHVGVNAAGAHVARAVTASLAGATHGSMRLRGVAGKPKPMGVLFRPARDDAKPRAFVAGKPAGQWSWLESGTKKHIVGAGRGAVGTMIQGRSARVTRVTKAGKYSTRTAKRKVLKIGDRFVYGPFMAGGSPAKRTFSRAVNAAEPEVPRIMAKATMANTVKAMNGR